MGIVHHTLSLLLLPPCGQTLTSLPAPAWDPSRGRQSSLIFSSMDLFHGLQFSTNWDSCHWYHRGSFWQLLSAATSVVPLLPKHCHANLPHYSNHNFNSAFLKLLFWVSGALKQERYFRCCPFLHACCPIWQVQGEALTVPPQSLSVCASPTLAHFGSSVGPALLLCACDPSQSPPARLHPGEEGRNSPGQPHCTKTIWILGNPCQGPSSVKPTSKSIISHGITVINIITMG